MKLVLVSMVVFSVQAFACGSVDETLQAVKAGTATTIDYDRAVICQIESLPIDAKALCQTRVGIYSDLVAYTQQALNVGLATHADLVDAQAKLASAQANCSRN